MSNTPSNEFDEFDGIDDSAFLSIDENAAMTKYVETKRSPDDVNKRQRVSENPYKSSLKKNESPFGDNSPFSTGSKVNYQKYHCSPPKPRESFEPAINLQYVSSSSIPPQMESLSKAEIEQFRKDLEQTLKKYYGFDTFRDGQFEIISSLLHPKNPVDCAVFWATGSGKSLCYQLPALHSNKTAIVISPLISLMQDQCDKLNGSSANKDEKIANFLGSAQTDPQVERDVLQGKYKVVYCTPELLLANGGYFLDRLVDIQEKISLIAIDEAHCVSEWGNDFRPHYRRIGEHIQARPNLRIPLLALTATATPRVRHDIIASLKLRNPRLSVHSFDRDNLQISVHRKPQQNSYMQAFKPFIEELKKEKTSHTSSGGMSTIIYSPSKSLVDEISSFLSKQFEDTPNVQVQPYHAGLALKKRADHHTNFLIGKTDVIVATIAFGMGIDKPDIRRVFHYGAPKTMEEYYQQIGRAGRDGLPAQCVMWANDSDFSKYASDFYTKSLTKDAKQFVKESTESLRTYAMDTEVCRRAALLKYFSEEPPFGKYCGTCDTCLNRKKYAGIDLHRDFRSEGATVILLAIQALNEASMSILEKVMTGKIVEDYRYNRRFRPQLAQEAIVEARSRMKKKRPIHYFKELVPALVQKGYIEYSIKTGTGKYKTTWSAYSISSKGVSALSDPKTPIELPVPPSIRQVEAEEEEKRQAILASLQQAGVDLTKIPKQEINDGQGDAIKAHQKWLSHLSTLEKAGRTDRFEELKDLRRQIEFWRYHTAEKLRMAPASVMSDHLLVKVAYASASSPTPVVAEALEAAGVRSAGLNHLVEILGNWWSDTNSKSDISTSRSNSKTIIAKPGDAQSSRMTFPKKDGGYVFHPEKSWQFAVYKPNKKTGLASWESSVIRFTNGEHPQAIAMNPENGRPIQVNTVIGHILTGLTFGRPIHLERLSNVVEPPSRLEWSRLREAESAGNFDVVGNASVSMTEFLRPIMGDEFVDQPRENRTPEETKEFSRWCQHLHWYFALRRVGYEPCFGEVQTTDV